MRGDHHVCKTLLYHGEQRAKRYPTFLDEGVICVERYEANFRSLSSLVLEKLSKYVR